jgi:tRNA-dihydrouridine synthase
VVVNGDIVDVATARAALAASGADAVMVGRGAQGAPWTPAVIAAGLDGGAAPAVPAGTAFADLVAGHYAAMLSHYGRDLGARIARKHLGWFAGRADLPDAARRALLTTAAPDEVTDLVLRVFAEAPGPAATAAAHLAA